MKTNEKTRLRNKKWRDNNPEKMHQIRTNWIENNKEYIKKHKAAKQAEKRKLDPDKYKKELTEWRLKNHDKVLEHGRRWREKNRVELTIKQRGRNYKTNNKINKEDIDNWETRLCGICKEYIEDKFHIDHKIPLSKGGPHEVSNLQLTHPSCNLRKKDKITGY